MSNPIFTVEQFLAIASLLNEKIAEVEALAEDVARLDDRNARLDDRNAELYVALAERTKYLDNLQGHVSDLKQELSRFTCPIDEEQVKAQEEANWAEVESRFTRKMLDNGNKIAMVKIVRDVFGYGLRDAKDAMERHFYNLGKLKPRFLARV